MKKIIILIAFLTIGSLTLLAQAPPTPPGNASTGNPGPVGGTAPVGSGLVVLLALGALYGGTKAYHSEADKQ